MRFIGVCGGRYYGLRRCSKHMGGFFSKKTPDCDDCQGMHDVDANLLQDVLEQETAEGDVIVHGGAQGADDMAGEFAHNMGRHAVVCIANWDKLGHRAGPIRNSVIAALPLSLLIAFPGGRGTADMVAKARAKGIEVLEVKRP